MQLVFEVCDTGLGESRACKTFDSVGGVIGRGAACDWVIADPLRLMSSHHGLVSYRDGQYYLADISSNGIGVSGSPERLRKGLARQIRDGDIYVLGSVSIRARLKGQDRQTVFLDPLIPDDSFLGLDPVHALDNAQRRSESCVELAALNSRVQGTSQPIDHGAAERDHWIVPQWAEPVQTVRTPAPEKVSPATDEQFWLQFGEALGVSLEALDTLGRERLAVKVAGLLRQAIDGLQQGLRTRDELNSELSLGCASTTAKEHNALSNWADGQSALAALLGGDEAQPLSAELAIAHACRDLQVHQLALVVASRAVVRSALAGFAPDHLLLCFERDGKPSRFSTDGTRWRAYQRHYQQLVDRNRMADRLIREDFSHAYQEQVRLVCTLHATCSG
ncbi:type VI secretion system-associated FHA domain protein TagH [Pseudomonas nabeulensis]|uniref:Type VI secretion system-associated FHA domain protein TagH n=1 Tax=Pseudomonas nabeulensis TaxID=2293833 RepID=A0A4Z0ANQ0_9PSED|nr:type VI secretion system-associated FHA domain protein TagH [Pseudomonas nabeulensis]TFY88001.1 type VI secretion system-associated FHA domain protein TagH [Pseudomonas nabeulensis]